MFTFDVDLELLFRVDLEWNRYVIQQLVVKVGFYSERAFLSQFT